MALLVKGSASLGVKAVVARRPAVAARASKAEIGGKAEVVECE